MQPVKTVVFWGAMVIAALLLWQMIRAGSPASSEQEVSYSDFLTRIADGQISKVTVAGNVVHARDSSGRSLRVVAPANQSMMLDVLHEKGAEIWFKEAPEGNWSTWFLNLAPLLLLGALWFFMVRTMRRGSQNKGAGAFLSSPGSPNSPRS